MATLVSTAAMRLEETDEYLRFPYTAQRRPDGINHGYFDLKRNPGQAAEIPELYGWPEMEDVIVAINRRDSL
jgi:hypothetical protein